jgi:ABC-2 type transport system ATP-binding protein
VSTVLSTTGATTAGTAIWALGLRKSSGEKTVLDGIDLTVPQGTILALRSLSSIWPIPQAGQ